jgi:DNA-binding transcriptional regulator YiaG
MSVKKPLRRMQNGIEDQNLKFAYKLINLNLLDCSPLLESEEPTDWVLAVLCRMDKEERDLRELLRRFKNLPEPKREKYLRFLFHIARLRPKRLNLLLKEVKQMSITIEVEKDPLFLKGLEKGVEKTKKEDVIRLYKATQWNTKKIAEVLNVPEEKVKQWLREEGLWERSKS